LWLSWLELLSLLEFGEGRVHEELAADAGDEDAGAQAYPDAAEVREADDLFERLASGAAGDELAEIGRAGGGPGEHGRLVLGEDAAGFPELDYGVGEVGNCHDAML
jgi:hypothetical protein